MKNIIKAIYAGLCFTLVMIVFIVFINITASVCSNKFPEYGFFIFISTITFVIYSIIYYFTND